jgi:hypothetical protein
MFNRLLVSIGAVVPALVISIAIVNPAWSADPTVTCESGKLKEAAKYGQCRLKEESKGVKKGVAPDFTKCESKFSLKWQKVETKGAGLCPTNGDEAAIDQRITDHADDVAVLLSGGSVPGCQQFPASGQTTAFGAGSDGDVQAGAPLAYTDNGDGTITDLNTGLMWEKKDDSGGIHDKDNTYTWSTGTNNMDGTIVTTFLNTLNDVAGGGASCFAGHCDWRVPNAKELPSIVDYQVFNPSVDPAFHQSATCTGCTDVTLASCSCTASSIYWSSTTVTDNPGFAWFVSFSGGVVGNGGSKTGSLLRVRAVRGGL